MGNVASFFSDNTKIEKRLAGLFGTLDLGYKNMIYLSVAGRNDWASTFAPTGKNNFFYPSASTSFVFTELLPNKDLLSYGKIRVSYAKAGREAPAYSSRTYFLQPFFTDGFTNGIGFPYLGVNGYGISSTLGNSALKPEIRTSYEAGLDLKFLQNRFTAGFTYYYDKSTDLLVRRPLPSTTGVRSVFSNIGEMENKGVEIELNFDILQENKNGFGWNITGNMARNRSKVLKLAPGVPEISLESAFTGIGSYAIEGQPFGAFFGTKWKRTANGALLIGTNGLPVKDPANQYIGNPYPKWNAGIRNTFSFKGVSVTALLDIREGASIWGGTIGRLYRIGKMEETADRNRTFVIEGELADGTKNTKAISAQDYFGRYLGDNGSAEETKVYDASWKRLRELTVSYTLPDVAKWLKGATLYFTGRNLWLSTPYKGVDPETSLTGAGSQIGGFDYFNMPGTKSLIFGLRTDF
jgi:outer membrane receptor protein involved in Fe transport